MQYRFTKICVFTLLVLFCIINGCTVKYIDRVTIFEIKGEVYDNKSQTPIENVAVRFKDTGFDYIRSKKSSLITIGHSDADGKFSVRLNYLWHRKDTTFEIPPQKTFEIVLDHEEYEARRFHYDESNLEQGGMRFEINLEKVYLLPKKAVEK